MKFVVSLTWSITQLLKLLPILLKKSNKQTMNVSGANQQYNKLKKKKNSWITFLFCVCNNYVVKFVVI